jgi:hypothetical protein
MKLIQLNDTYGYEDFITNEEQSELLLWANSNSHLFNVNETGSDSVNAPYGSRKIGILKKIKNSPLELVKKIKDRVIEIEQIKNWKEEPDFKDAIGIHGDSGAIHIHTDRNAPGHVHVRYNVILSYPNEGGHSIYNDKINILKERMVWRCVAGKIPHGSTTVVGDKPRITLTLGFLIPEIQKVNKSFL